MSDVEQVDGSVFEHRLHIKAQGLVREVFLNLVKHGRTSRLYGAGHRHARRFLDAYTQALLSFLEEFEVMQVEVTPDDFLWQGQPVLSKATNAQQMTYGLYAEGARGLSIERGTETRETVKLADLLSRDWLRRTEFDDDLIAACWRADFEHVHVDVADRFTEEQDDGGDSALREDLALGRSAGTDAMRMTGDSVLVPQIQGLLRELQADALRQDQVVTMKQDEAEVFLQLKDELEMTESEDVQEREEEELLQMDEGARQALAAEIQQIEEEEDVGLDDVAGAIFEIVRLEPDSEKVQQLGAELAKLVVFAIERGESPSGGTLLRRVLCLGWSDLFPDHDLGPFLEGLSSLLSEANIARMVPSLQRQAEAGQDLGAIFSVLSSLPLSVIPGLLRLGESVNRMEVRQVIADALVILMESDLDALNEMLEQVEGVASVVPLLALGRLEAIRAMDICLGRVRDPEAEAREAALRALRRHRSTRIKDVMADAIGDDAQGVRIEALRYLAVYRITDQQQKMEALLRGGVLEGVTEREAKAWTQALAHIGRQRAVPLLHAMALGELPGSDQVQVQKLALQGLYATGVADGRRAVDEVARRRPELREMVRELATEQRRKKQQARA